MTPGRGQLSARCPGSGAFPGTYDGEFTRCETCGRKLNLDRGGRVPSHNSVAPENYRPASTERDLPRDRSTRQRTE